MCTYIVCFGKSLKNGSTIFLVKKHFLGRLDRFLIFFALQGSASLVLLEMFTNWLVAYYHFSARSKRNAQRNKSFFKFCLHLQNIYFFTFLKL